MAEPRLSREEVAASLAAGRDLGPDYDDAVADSLAERVQDAVDERVRCTTAERTQVAEARSEARTSVAIASLIFAVPLSAIAAGTAGWLGLLLTWVGILLVNLILAWEPGS